MGGVGIVEEDVKVGEVDGVEEVGEEKTEENPQEEKTVETEKEPEKSKEEVLEENKALKTEVKALEGAKKGILKELTEDRKANRAEIANLTEIINHIQANQDITAKEINEKFDPDEPVTAGQVHKIIKKFEQASDKKLSDAVVKMDSVNRDGAVEIAFKQIDPKIKALVDEIIEDDGNYSLLISHAKDPLAKIKEIARIHPDYNKIVNQGKEDNLKKKIKKANERPPSTGKIKGKGDEVLGEMNQEKFNNLTTKQRNALPAEVQEQFYDEGY